MKKNRLFLIINQNVEIFLFLVISLIFQLYRQSVHVDEGRYLTSAFEMYTSGNYLIPHLNGQPYSHKPPLLFWITCLFWKIFGVSEFVARQIPILSTVLTSYLVRTMATRQAQQIFLSFGFVFIWSEFYMFDSLMMLWVTLGFYALHQKKTALLSLSVTCGFLTKGPVIFVYLIPAAYFLKTPLFFGFLGGLFFPLVWLGLALNYGDDSYRDALLWKQTTGRLVNSFNHQRGWWFYLVMLPVILLPWIATPNFWKKNPLTDSQKIILKSILVSLFIFQLISCKQIQYLLPLMPLAALFISEHLKLSNFKIGQISMVGYLGILIASEHLIQKRHPIQEAARLINPSEPVTIVSHRYRGEFGFLLRQPKVAVIAEETYHQSPKTGRLIVYTNDPEKYPKAIAVFEQKAGHYLLVVKPESVPVANNGS